MSNTQLVSILQKADVVASREGGNESAESTLPYVPTPGIDIATVEVDNIGTLCVWDCAGHIEYHVTHGMFLGSENAMAVVAYDIRNSRADVEVRLMRSCSG